MAIANQEMIRDNNRRQVLEYLVNHPPVSRAALSQQLHLTKATISNIVQELIEQKSEALRLLLEENLFYLNFRKNADMHFLLTCIRLRLSL